MKDFLRNKILSCGGINIQVWATNFNNRGIHSNYVKGYLFPCMKHAHVISVMAFPFVGVKSPLATLQGRVYIYPHCNSASVLLICDAVDKT